MKPLSRTTLMLFILGLLALATAFIAGSYFNQSSTSMASQTMGKDHVATLVAAVVGGLLLALFVLLIPDRWRRIESEILALRQGQDKALDDLRKRADERIADKLDGASRQAQGILDHVTNLSDRFPWIKGISETGFSPNSNAIQLVLRNSAKLVASGQGMLAHEYLYSWTRNGKDRFQLEGSPSDFLQISDFSQIVLGDEYLSMLLVSIGYKSRTRQLLLASRHLRALSRNGMIADSVGVAESIRRRALPTWRERFGEVWYAAQKLSRPTVRPPRPTAEECSALAIFFGVVGDEGEFKRALAKAQQLSATSRDKLLVTLAQAEGLATLGAVLRATDLLKNISTQLAAAEGLVCELAWALRRCSLDDDAAEILSEVSQRALEIIRGDFSSDGSEAASSTRSPSNVRSSEPNEAATQQSEADVARVSESRVDTVEVDGSKSQGRG